MSGRRLDVPAQAQPRLAARRGSLPVGSSLQGHSAMATWQIPTSNQPRHAQDDSSMDALRARPFQQTPARAQQDQSPMKFIHRSGNQVRVDLDHSLGPSSKYPHGVHKLVPPTTGFMLPRNVAPAGRRTPSPQATIQTANNVKSTIQADVELPDGTLHVWVYQARHLVFRRLFETMYERHGLRLRVYAGSRATQDVGEIYETRRNYGGNMANPRWRRDQDDARDDAHGHFRIPLARASLRIETELTVEIVCGILVVAHTTISLPALFLGSFGTTLAVLAAHNMQFRPHWFPLSGEDAGLIEMALEFIPTRIVPPPQPTYEPKQHMLSKHNQPESEYDDEEEDDEDSVVYDQHHHDHYEQYQLQLQHAEQPQSQRRGSRSPEQQHYEAEKEMDRQRAREYEALERHDHMRRQRFEMLEDPHETRPQERARSATTASSSSSSSTRSTRFVLPRRQSLSVLDGDDHHDQEPLYHHHHHRSQSQYDFDRHYYAAEEEGLVIMDAYDENSPPPSEFSGYELHDSGFEATTTADAIPYSDGQSYASRTSSDYDNPLHDDDLSMSASSSWASASTMEDPSQENLQNKQLWDLYRYGISDESPEEIDTSRHRETSANESASLRDSSLSMASMSSSIVSRQHSTMSQASNYSIAFSDASEASMLSRDASTCASEILTYNDRIQRMEEAIRLARERRVVDETNPGPSNPPRPAAPPTMHHAPQDGWKKLHIPAPISTKPTATLTAFGWERPSPPLASPASSEPVVLESRKGVVLFDVDHIPVKGRAGQTDPALEAYRAKMLARRRSLPIHMLSGGAGGGPGGLDMGRGGGGIRPSLTRERSAPGERLSIAAPEPSWPVFQGRAVQQQLQPKYDPHAREPLRWNINNNQQSNQGREDRASPVAARPVGVVDSPLSRVPSWHAKPKAYEEPVRSTRPSHDSECNSTSSIDLPGPPGLRRKRSSSLHSISDLLKDQSFRIHNIAVSSQAEPVPSGAQARGAAARRPSISDHSVGRSSAGSGGGGMGDRKLSKASSYASSDASSNSQPVQPSNNSSAAMPRVRRNSKGNGNLVQINGIALGIGKFINVGNVPGVIRYIGPTMFAPGQWIGIELVEKKGKHNGTVQNVQYFECAPEHGIFIRAERLDIST